MPTLHEMLSSLTVDDLKCRLNFLAPGSKILRKGELMEAIESALSGPGLKRVFDQLDETGRLAVSEAVFVSGGDHNVSRFYAKYGLNAEFHTKPEPSPSYYSWQSPKNATLLNVFFYPHGGFRRIPSDLTERLCDIAPEPPPIAVQCIPEPVADGELRVRHTESEALAELGILLRMADVGELCFGPKTGVPSKNSLAAIEASLVGGDWFPPEEAHSSDARRSDEEIGAIKAIGWTRLLQTAGLIAMTGAKSVLTPKGRRAVEEPAWKVIEAIWRKWIANKDYDEFNRIEIIKGQSIKGALTARVPRRTELLDALECCPVNEWVSFDEFSRYMQADGFTFDVAEDPWKLYIVDRQYGSMGYDSCGGWDMLQDRYMMCILMEYAATLGLVDIAYEHPDGARGVDAWGMDCYAWLSRYDGLQAFRINSLGEYVFSGGTTAFQPSRPTRQVRLSILTNRTIRVIEGSLSPTERTQLETWAEPMDDQSFRLDEARALEAIEVGLDPEGFVQFLAERDDQPLPETLRSFLEQARENGKALRQSGAAVLFECRDAQTADVIAASRELAGLCLRAGATTLAVREEALARFRKYIRTLGLGIR